MNKFLFGLFVALLSAVVAGLVSYGTIKYEDSSKEQCVTEAQVKDYVLSVVNPQMTSTSEVYALQETLRNNATTDSVFVSMPYKTLQNVATVVIKQKNSATKDDIVGEFLMNKKIYENLPPPEASNASTSTNAKSPDPTIDIKLVKEGTTTVTEGQPTRAVSHTVKDTTINGKKATVETTIKTYE